MYDIIVLGGGPAGLNAGLYAARSNMKVLIISKMAGGTIMEAHKVENWLGTRSIAGMELAQSFEAALQAGWGYGLIAVRILQALAAENLDEGLEFLADALRRGEPEGFLRSYVDAGESLRQLLQEAARRGISSDYVGQILEAFGEQSGASRVDQSQLVEPLSEREIEVLSLVATGLSNREIAAKLFISAGTVKTHVHHICGKLEVRNRLEAVTRAQELHLV